MDAARSTPLLDLLAENDNALDDTGVLSSCPRARAALAAPLTRPESVPAAPARRFHDVAGERQFSSIVAVEQYGGAPRWRVSVTLQGRPNAERRELAMILAQQVMSGLGEGPLTIERRPSTIFVRRALSARERAAVARTRLAVALQP